MKTKGHKRNVMVTTMRGFAESKCEWYFVKNGNGFVDKKRSELEKMPYCDLKKLINRGWLWNSREV